MLRVFRFTQEAHQPVIFPGIRGFASKLCQQVCTIVLLKGYQKPGRMNLSGIGSVTPTFQIQLVTLAQGVKAQALRPLNQQPGGVLRYALELPESVLIGVNAQRRLPCFILCLAWQYATPFRKRDLCLILLPL